LTHEGQKGGTSSALKLGRTKGEEDMKNSRGFLFVTVAVGLWLSMGCATVRLDLEKGKTCGISQVYTLHGLQFVKTQQGKPLIQSVRQALYNKYLAQIDMSDAPTKRPFLSTSVYKTGTIYFDFPAFIRLNGKKIPKGL